MARAARFPVRDPRDPAGEKLAATLRAQLRTPQAAAMLQEAAAQFWGIWVGGWLLEEPPAPGTSEEFVHERQLGDGRKIAVPFTVTHRGPAPRHPDRVRLATEEVFEGAVAKALLGSAMRTMLAGMIAEEKKEEHEIREYWFTWK